MALTKVELIALVAGQLLSSQQAYNQDAMKDAVQMAINIIREAETAWQAAEGVVRGSRRG